MVNKVRVYGKAQNRTALGIVHAYMVMFPQATLTDLRKAFPNELNNELGTKYPNLFVPVKEADSQWYFTNTEEVISTGDGQKVAFVKMWPQNVFDSIVRHASQYGIEIAKFEAAEKGFGKKGGFRLEYLNGFIPPKASKGLPKWIWILLAILLLLIGFFLWDFLTSSPEIVEKEVVVRDTVTVYVQQLEEIEKNFNAAEFEQGKAELSEKAKFVLHDLGTLLKKNPKLKVRIVGHTSAEGEVDFNKKLSEKRAKAARDFLVEHAGIEIYRLQYFGKGSEELKNPQNPMAKENRRTEFEVID